MIAARHKSQDDAALARSEGYRIEEKGFGQEVLGYI